MSDALSVDHFSIRLEEAHLLAVGERLESNAVRFLRTRIEDRHFRQRQRHRLLEDAALLTRLRVGLLMPLHRVDALDDHLVAREHLQHRALPTLVSACEHDDLIAFSDLSAHVHSTSGASEMIFMNCTLRSSRVTGPKMRVPIGSSLVVNSTAALPSKRTSHP